jgi:DNA-binding MarR family transcriptional regulator
VAGLDLSHLEHAVGFALKRAQMAVSRDIHRAFADVDITAVQYSVLTVVAANPGIAQAELATVLDVERPRMVPVIDSLTTRGLAERRTDENDRRGRQIHLTRAGRKLLRELQARFSVHEERVAAVLGEHDVQVLLSALQRLTELPR